VSWIIRALPSREMTAGIAAIGWSDLKIVIVVDMARSAGNVCVAIGQEKTGSAVIEDCGCPTNSVVAGGTIGSGKSSASRDVRRVIGLLPLGKVAILASARSEIVVVVDVASGTSQIGMAVGKQKARGAVIEFSTEPTVETVACRALTGSKSGTGAGVRRIGGVLPVFQMAGITLGGEAEKLTDGSTGMTRLARNGGMSAEKRETILVILDLLGSEFPTLDGMALRAVRTQLASVNIGMTVGAIFADVGEYRLYVALNAFHFFVHAAKRVLGFAVVEFRDSADRAPSSGSVAIFAGNAQRTVRITRGAFLGGRMRLREDGGSVRRRQGSRRREGKQGPKSELER
jgi:hypothetical protein